MTEGFRCSCCGEWHDSLLMSYGIQGPAAWFGLAEGERGTRAELSSDDGMKHVHDIPPCRKLTLVHLVNGISTIGKNLCKGVDTLHWVRAN
jgi:hypothetical protein